MVAAVRKGESERAVARRFRVHLRTIQRWVKRAQGKRLDRVDWTDRPRGPHQVPHRTDPAMETLVIQTRHELRQQSDLGEYGAEAVRRTLLEGRYKPLPSVRTINRIFSRYGLLDKQRSQRRKAPPKGWYLSDVASACAELDQIDLVEGLKIKAGPLVEVLNVVSLHGGLVASYPQQASISAKDVVVALADHWHEWGLPDYAQFDNATVFQGPHQHQDVVGRVMRLCLSLGVVPVFVTPREMGFQASIEGYNGKWQAKVWGRFEHASLEALQGQSSKYVTAHRARTAKRRESAPTRQRIPLAWELDLQAHPQGRMVYIRRTSQRGEASVLGHSFEVDDKWKGRLVRCEVLLNEALMRFYRLRRREPQEQPLLNEVPYELPKRRFQA